MAKPVVFIVCTGLGKINRGFETFTRECFDNLKHSKNFDLYLIKGAGNKNEKEKVVFNIHRKSKLAKYIQQLFSINVYAVEQISFTIGLLPLIIKKKPALIYYSDFALGSLLWHLRKYLQFNYRLLFCNGAPNGPPYKTEDHIQQLLPVYYSIGMKADNNISKYSLLPYAFNIHMQENIQLANKREALRNKLGFTNNQKLVLTVGAINKRHKRIDYVINEVALLPEEYFLIALGEFDDDTPELIKLAEEKLPGRFFIANLPQEELKNYYTAADYFVLASLFEGFGRVSVEALSYGLPCILHDFVVSRQVLQNYGIYLDMRFEGVLSGYLLENFPAANKTEVIQAAYTMYSWDALKEKYAAMISQQIALN